ncbi:MAG: DUF2934 domain-containing protein [Acidobacteriota bacterium]
MAPQEQPGARKRATGMRTPQNQKESIIPVKKIEKTNDTTESKPKAKRASKKAVVAAPAAAPAVTPAPVQAKAQATEIAATVTIKPSQQVIAARAHELWVLSGRKPGRDLENWLAAEKDIRSSLPAAQ